MVKTYGKTYSKKDINDNLRQLMTLELQISTKTEELSRWREISEKTAGIAYSHAKTGRMGGRGSRIEDCVLKIDAIERVIKDDVEKLLLLKTRISGIIEKINDPVCKSLLSLRYLNAMSWEQVAEFMNYSYVHVVNRLHPKALNKFDALYSEASAVSDRGNKNSG